MARLDRAALDAADFPFTVTIPTRYDDLDPQGHVNNAAATVILQEARVAFNRAAGLPVPTEDLRTMVAALRVEYAAEMRHPDPVDVSVGVLALGRTSFTLALVARQGGGTALYAESVLVVTDERGPAAIPPHLRERLERLAIA